MQATIAGAAVREKNRQYAILKRSKPGTLRREYLTGAEFLSVAEQMQIQGSVQQTFMAKPRIESAAFGFRMISSPARRSSLP